MTQDELKALVGQAALAYVVPGAVVGVGTGSTVNHFIDALATMKAAHRRRGVELRAQHRSACARTASAVFDANEVRAHCRSTSTAPTRSTAAAA